MQPINWGRPLRSVGAVALFAMAAVACGDDPIIVELDNIPDIVTSTADVSTLQAALEASGLLADLSGNGPFTVFAPSNAAFDALGADVIAALLEPGNAGLLAEILQLHVVAGTAAFSADLTDGQTVTTLQGEDLTIGVAGGGVTVNGAAVVTADIEASNGVIHLIDAVLTPAVDIVEKAILTAETQTLVTAVAAGDLVATLQGAGPFTVFAPTNSAFAALDAYTLNALLDPANVAILQEVLTYHVIPGDIRAADLTDGAMVTTVEGRDVTIDLSGPTPKVDGIDIIATDIVVENGVIHLIDGVLLPEFDIVEKALITDGTGTLAAAVDAGGLVGTLTGAGPFTVFAPIDAAFEALGTDKLDVLLDPANQALLAKILTYHVVSGDIRAADLMDGAMVTTVEGSDVTIDLSGAMPMVNGANIIATDIVVENGVIHLIDGVLTENADLVDVATLNQFDTLVSLVDQAGLVATLRGDNGGAGYTVFAPTDAAFAALSSVPSGQALVDVLTYHVVGSTVPSSALMDGQVVTTVEGSTFTVNISGSDVTLTDGTGAQVSVILTDVPASNGVVHVIDGVIMPS